MLTGAARHPGRLLWRAVGLAWGFLGAAADWWRRPECRSREPAGNARARWLTRHSRRCLRALRAQVEWSGPVPDSGLLVANHLGYLDVLAIAAVVPATFVAKSEVRRWPLIGNFVRMAGTLWVERTRRSATGRTVTEIEEALGRAALVVLFPEGTSSAGHTVLPIKPALLEPACGLDHVWVAHIHYELPDGSVAEAAAYWGDATFGLHLINLLTQPEITARIHCERAVVACRDRKQLARQLQTVFEGLGAKGLVGDARAEPGAASGGDRALRSSS